MTEIETSRRVLRQLWKIVKSSRLSINELRVTLALERIVARIDAHKVLREKLIFKGGYVLFKSFYSQRFTRDLDALVRDVPKEELVPLVTDALRFDLEDGVYFAEPDIQDLVDQVPYGGYRIKIPFQIGPLPDDPRKIKKLSRVHLDVGFGDVYYGRANRQAFPQAIVEDSSITWRIYPIESIYAEKLETFVSRGSANSRPKDLYDLVVFFDKVSTSKSLVPAILKTFKNRGTAVPTSLAAFEKQLDFTILERSWGSVELAGGKMSFEDCRSRFQRLLKKLDARLADY